MFFNRPSSILRRPTSITSGLPDLHLFFFPLILSMFKPFHSRITVSHTPFLQYLFFVLPAYSSLTFLNSPTFAISVYSSLPFLSTPTFVLTTYSSLHFLSTPTFVLHAYSSRRCARWVLDQSLHPREAVAVIREEMTSRPYHSRKRSRNQLYLLSSTNGRFTPAYKGMKLRSCDRHAREETYVKGQLE